MGWFTSLFSVKVNWKVENSPFHVYIVSNVDISHAEHV